MQIQNENIDQMKMLGSGPQMKWEHKIDTLRIRQIIGPDQEIRICTK